MSDTTELKEVYTETPARQIGLAVNHLVEGRIPRERIKAVKESLRQVLIKREREFEGFLRTRNPSAQRREQQKPGAARVYEIPTDRGHLVGSASSILDATAALIRYRPFADVFSLALRGGSQTKGVETQPGEHLNITRNSVSRDEGFGFRVRTASRPALSGSAAQNSIQPYPADIDLNQKVVCALPAYSTLEAYRAELGENVAASLQRVVMRLQRQSQLAGINLIAGSEFQAVGTGALREKPLQWTVDEIIQGFKERLVVLGGRLVKQKFSLEDALLSGEDIGLHAHVVLRNQSGQVVDTATIATRYEVIIDGEPLQVRRKSTADALHNVYYDSESDNSIERTVDPDLFINYIHSMRSAVAAELKKPDSNMLPSYPTILKRLYNLCRAFGDPEMIDRLAPIFKKPEMEVYQLTAKLKGSFYIPNQEVRQEVQRFLMGRLHNALSKQSLPFSFEEVMRRGGVQGVIEACQQFTNSKVASELRSLGSLPKLSADLEMYVGKSIFTGLKKELGFP